MERGEVQGGHTTAEILTISRQDWLKERKISVLVQYSQSRHRLFPDIPAMVELGKTPDDKQILALYGSTAEIGRAVMTPPEVPAERMETLRAAFDAMLKDPQFLAEIEKRQMEFEPMSGKELQARIAETLKISPAVAERAAKARE